MRKAIIALIAALLTTAATAQTIEELAAMLATNRVELSYDCMAGQGAPVHFSGRLTAQGNCYHLTGNGLDIWCDGTTRWSLDPEAKEVYIESSEGIREVLSYRNSISEISVSDVKITASPEEASFFFDVSKLDNSWVITDLRQ